METDKKLWRNRKERKEWARRLQQVYLVNARHTKNLPWRKSDVQESQWLLKLHTYGLLNNSFHPASAIRTLRTYWRQRAARVEAAATCILRMQKALTQMNLQLANVISDLSGVTGQKIVRAIVAGEHDPQQLAKLRDARIQASHEEIAKSLEGNWHPERVLCCSRKWTCMTLISSGSPSATSRYRSIWPLLPITAISCSPPHRKEKARRKKPTKNARAFNLSHELERISGVDLTRIDGIEVMVAQTFERSVGLDMSRWKTEAHFSSWLGLCPDNRISGDRVLRRGTRRVISRAATALRMAATTLLRSPGYLGAQHRRLRTKLGAPKAITRWPTGWPDWSIVC